MTLTISVAALNADWRVDERWTLMALAAFMIPVIAITQVRAGILHGFNKVLASKAPELLLQPISFLLIALMLFFSGNLTPLSAIFAQLFAAIIALAAVSLLIQPLTRAFSPEIFYADRAWGVSLVPFSLIAAVSYVNTSLFIPLTGLLASSVDVAHFKLSLTLALLISAPLTIVEWLVYPHVTRLYHERNITRLLRLTTRSGIIAFIISLPVSIFFIGFGRDVLQILYGPEFLGAYYSLIALAVGFSLVNLVGPSMLLLHATRFEKDALLISLASTVLVICLCILWIPKYGALGAALAFIIPKLGRAIVFWILGNYRLRRIVYEED